MADRAKARVALGVIGFIGGRNVDLSRFALHAPARMNNRFTRLMLPGCDVELPAVPGASDDASRKLSFPQRTTLMRADTVERVPCVVDMKHSYDAAIGDAFECATGRNIFGAGDSKPLLGQRCTYEKSGLWQSTKPIADKFSLANQHRARLRRQNAANCRVVYHRCWLAHRWW